MFYMSEHSLGYYRTTLHSVAYHDNIIDMYLVFCWFIS